MDCFRFQDIHFSFLLPRCHHIRSSISCAHLKVYKCSLLPLWMVFMSGVKFANNCNQIIDTDLDFSMATQSFFLSDCASV